jgi:hypothetical protein
MLLCHLAIEGRAADTPNDLDGSQRHVYRKRVNPIY